MFVQGRSWGPRTRAWLFGLLLLFLTFLSGWTGYVMVWDGFARVLAVEGARLMDAVPIFAEPLARAFVGERPIPGAFFFLNLFAHVAVPVGMALLMWIHVSRLARPVLLPPRGLLWAVTALLVAASLLVPAPLGPRADAFALTEAVPMDWFYAFWLPASRALAPLPVWIAFGVTTLVVGLIPWWSRPRHEERPPVSAANGRLCTGCVQCSIDCPFEAIAMIDAVGIPDARSARVAQVDPALCVSCGICSASCAPMAVGPPLRTGRDQLAQVREFLAERRPGAGEIVLLACRNGAGRFASRPAVPGAAVLAMSCAGNLHTSVIEHLVRAGVGGVLIASCPPRDCRNREGPKWQAARIESGREAELHERVDRRRIAVVYAGEAEPAVVLRALAEQRAQIEALGRAHAEDAIELAAECEPPPLEAGAP
jgi:ferredoxin